MGLLPDKMIRVITGKSPRTPEAYAKLLKAYPVPVKGAHSLERAQVCSGGVSLSEVNLWNHAWFPAFILPVKFWTSAGTAEAITCNGPGPPELWQEGLLPTGTIVEVL